MLLDNMLPKRAVFYV